MFILQNNIPLTKVGSVYKYNLGFETLVVTDPSLVIDRLNYRIDRTIGLKIGRAHV